MKWFFLVLLIALAAVLAAWDRCMHLQAIPTADIVWSRLCMAVAFQLFFIVASAQHLMGSGGFYRWALDQAASSDGRARNFFRTLIFLPWFMLAFSLPMLASSFNYDTGDLWMPRQYEHRAMAKCFAECLKR